MYIRETKHRSKKGKEYCTHKLVESIRTPRGPRQRIVLNLGATLELPKEQWGELANRIEEILHDIKVLFSCSEEIESLAQRFAKLILRKQAKVVKTNQEEEETEGVPADYQRIDLNSLKNVDVRTVGGESILLDTIAQLGFERKLKKLGFSSPQVNVALGSIAMRALYPGSERSSLSALQHNSALGDLLEKDFSAVSLSQLYKISDRLLSNKDLIENFLYSQEVSLFDLRETLILYDLTNTYFEGGGGSNPKAKHGRSKEKRTDCPLVTLGLVLDGNGFCKRSRIFDGNVSEGKTLKSMINGLKSDNELFKPIVVMDAGIATENNIQWLRRESHWLDYIVVSRKAKKAFPEQGTPITLRKNQHNHVQAVLLKNEETQEIELYCHSTAKAKKEQSIKTHFQLRFEEELTTLEAGLRKKGHVKNFGKIVEKVGRLKEKYKKIAHLYAIDVKKEKDTDKTCAITWKKQEIKEKNTLEGYYSLRTSIQTFNESEIWNTYTMLTGIEAAFRSMKSELGMRPIFHQKETRVDGHLFITVLAYHLVHTIRYQLMQKEIHDSWESIRQKMATQVRATIQMKMSDGTMVSIRKSSEPEMFHKKIYNALGFSTHPGKIEKTFM